MSLQFWQVLDRGSVTGPFATEQLRSRLASGLVTNDARVWREGLSDWSPIRDHLEPVAVVRNEANPSRGLRSLGGWLVLALSSLEVWLGTVWVIGLAEFHFSDLIPAEWLVAVWAASGAVLLLATCIAAPLWWRRGRRISRTQPELGAGIAAATLVISFVAAAGSLVELAATPRIARTVSAEAVLQYTLRYVPAERTVYLTGYIGPHLWLRLQPYIGAKGPAKRLVLTSRGGLIDEAMRVARTIEARGDFTTVARGECDSACTVVLMSGKARLADYDMQIGFHAVAPVADRDNPLVVDLVARRGRDSEQYLRSRGVPPAIVARAHAVGPTRVVDVSAIRLVEAGALTGLLDGDKPLSLAEAKARLALQD
jgi:hypothetical protein